jgi:hypothetical protein
MCNGSWRMMLSSHEILRFSVEQANMRFRHLGLHRDRVCMALRDDSPARNLWELVHIGDTLRLTRFPKLRPPSFDGPVAHSATATITPELFARVLATHRPAIVQTIREQITFLANLQASASGLHEDEAKAAEDRKQELQQVASRLFPRDFPG